MKAELIAATMFAALSWASAASAQSLQIGATYHCVAPVPDFILESCSGDYCHVQSLNPYAPDGRGAAIDMYRTQMADRMKGCTPTGGTSTQEVRTFQSVAPAPREAEPNPAYIAGAGAGVDFHPQATRAPAGGLVANSYYCTAFIGTPPNGHLATMPGLSILAGGRYRHQDGSIGTITTSGNTMVFHGGSLDGQAATFDAGATGRGTVHLYNASRSRTVIDCDGHG